MEIKTISYRLDNCKEFDAEVNAALAEGWNLEKRDVILPRQPHNKTRYFNPMLYAELVKLPETKLQADPMTWQEAMRVVHQECASHAFCADCPAYLVCNAEYPQAWDMSNLGGAADG